MTIEILCGSRDSVPMNSLEREISKLINCTFVSPTIISEVSNIKNYDLIVIGPFASDLEFYRKLKVVNKPKIMVCSDPQSDIAFHIYFAKKYNVKNMFMIYPSWIPEYQRRYAANYIPFPWWSDDYYKEVSKDINVMYTTANSPFYPMRYEMGLNELEMQTFYPIMKYGMADDRLPFDRYIEYLNRSRIFAFDGSFWDLCVLKYIEGMCCKTVMVAPTSLDTPELHLLNGGNYVQVSENNVFGVIKQLLKDEKRMETIANNARETFLKYHTTNIRAKQFVEQVKKIVNG